MGKRGGMPVITEDRSGADQAKGPAEAQAAKQHRDVHGEKNRSCADEMENLRKYKPKCDAEGCADKIFGL